MTWRHTHWRMRTLDSEHWIQMSTSRSMILLFLFAPAPRRDRIFALLAMRIRIRTHDSLVIRIPLFRPHLVEVGHQLELLERIAVEFAVHRLDLEQRQLRIERD